MNADYWEVIDTLIRALYKHDSFPLGKQPRCGQRDTDFPKMKCILHKGHTMPGFKSAHLSQNGLWF